MKSWYVHYKNKYPDAHITFSDDSFEVHGKLALRKNGGGSWVDISEELGLPEKHDLSPIPKEARVYKVCPKSARVIKDEDGARREKARSEFIRGEKVASCEELHKDGYRFDEKQRVVESGKKKAADAVDADIE